MTKTTLQWRLKERPSPESILHLVQGGILTKEEAKDILFSEQSEEERDKESLKAEIKFLRDLVEKLAERKQIKEVIREVGSPWKKWEWYEPYYQWSDGNNIMYYESTGENLIATNTVGSQTSGGNTCNNFSEIKTF